MKSKTFFLFSIMLLFAVFVNAQGPTLTFANTGIQPGDVYTFYSADTSGVNAGVGGAVQTWNFSSLSINATPDVINYVNPSVSPYFTNFPNATVADTSNGETYFYKVNSSEYTLLGFDNAFTTLTYSDPQLMLQYPFSYYAGNINDLVYGAHTVSGMSAVASGVSTSTADGFGTLILPSGTYYSLLRVKFTSDMRDSSLLYKLITSTTTYSWYDGINKYPLLSISRTSTSIMGTTTITKTVRVSSDAYTSINNYENKGSEIILMPNPASGFVNVSFETNNSSTVEISILDVQGNLVKFFNDKSNQNQLDISDLSKGMYFVRLNTEKGSSYKKLMVN